MLKLFPPGHPRDLEAHLEVNAALKSVPTLASMSALKCAVFLPLPFQLLKVFLDVWSLKFTPWHTGFYINHDFFIQHRTRAILSCLNKNSNDARDKRPMFEPLYLIYNPPSLEAMPFAPWLMSSRSHFYII